MHEKKSLGRCGIIAIIFIGSIVLPGCMRQNGSPIDLVPTRLVGFPDPISASFDSTQPFNGVYIAGGYGGREWLTEKEFVLAFVMDFKSDQEAAQRLAEAKLGGLVPIELGDEGYKAELELADGSPGFRFLMWRRGGFLVILGSGVLEYSGTAPSEQTLIDLSNTIDKTILEKTPSKTQPPVKYISHYPQEATSILFSGSLSLPSPLMLTTSALEDKEEGKVPTSIPLFRNDEGTQVGNGEVTLQFDVLPIPENGSQDYDTLEVRVYIDTITIGEFDGDDDWCWLIFPGRGNGEVYVAGEITVYSILNRQLVPNTEYFVTKELCEMGPGETKDLRDPKEAKGIMVLKMRIQNDKCSPLSATYDLYVRDNDSGDIVTIIVSLEELLALGVPKKLALSVGAAIVAQKLLITDCQLSSAQQSTWTDLGEAHSNSSTGTICISMGKCPDLTASIKLEDPSQRIIAGYPVIIIVTVKNEGEKKAEGVIVGKMGGASIIPESEPRDLEPGEEYPLRFPHIFGMPGLYTLTAFVDPHNTILESNEDNNGARLDIYVWRNLPPVYVETNNMLQIGYALPDLRTSLFVTRSNWSRVLFMLRSEFLSFFSSLVSQAEGLVLNKIYENWAMVVFCCLMCHSKKSSFS